jgi:hypothetical protein
MLNFPAKISQLKFPYNGYSSLPLLRSQVLQQKSGITKGATSLEVGNIQ